MLKVEGKKREELQDFMAECKKKEHSESQLIAILHKAQELWGYVEKDIMNDIAEYMEIPTAHIWGVATFYHYFNLKPVGKNIISVCMGTACYVKGAGKVLDAIKSELGIKIGETTEDKMFTLQEARCLGACGLAPVVMINDKIYGELDEKSAIDLIKKIGKETSAKKEG